MPALERGTKLAGGRYEILAMLGQGGMGAVYKAHDHEVDRVVALKVIQPELVSSSSILKRFKQELLLARQVTHKNVVRIFDIGESEGMKFITMEYVDGGDLKSLIIERGKIPAAEAVGIVRQICNALEAAHLEGVVHRDLKPQNIMIDQNGRVVVMDFGIAHSSSAPGMTMTGALMGTPDYMSPEQAKGQKVDARSDIFSLGLIFYEMLLGKVPFHAPTIVETMFKRTHERAVPPVELDSSVPVQANMIVMKCLETDAALRYQNVHELLADLESFDAKKKLNAYERFRLGLRRRQPPWKPAVVIGSLILIAVIGVLFIRNREGTAPAVRQQPRAMQILVADFTSSDPELSGTIEPVLGLAMEGASFIYNADRTRAKQTALRLKQNGLDEESARLVAASSGFDAVISGAIALRGAGYRIGAKAIETATGKTIAQSEADAANKADVPAAVSKLAASLRSALGDTASDEQKLAESETISTSSLEALRSYMEGQDFKTAGKWEEALRQYTHALLVDPNFGRAYAGIAAAHANLGHHDEAEKNYKLAMEHLDRMTDREKFRTRGGYYLFSRNTDNALKEYKDLVAKFPADTVAQSNISFALFLRRDFDGALHQGQEFIKTYPNNVAAIENVALYAAYAGDFGTADREAARALQMNPKLLKSYFARAISALAQGRIEDARKFYAAVKNNSTQGASLASAGLADISLYEGRFADAVSALQDGSAADLVAGEKSDAADKLATLALAYADLKQFPEAVAAADRALAYSREDSVLLRAAEAYVQAGEKRKPDPIVEELSKKDGDPRSFAILIQGEMLLKQKMTRDALDTFKAAQKISDSWLVHIALSRAYLELGQLTEAAIELDTCTSRKGEATAVFLDDRPTYHLFPQVLFYQARLMEAQKSPAAAGQYQAFLSLKQNADKDPLAAEARKRAK